MAEMKTFREASRTNFTVPGSTYTNEHLQAGSLMRIADSMEIIAKDKTDLLSTIEKLKKDVEYWRRLFYERSEQLATMTKRCNTYKGHFNRLRKRI
jgi:hypothetical protein